MMFVMVWMMYAYIKEKGYLPFKKSVKGKHIFLTGASSGIGRIMAKKLVNMGAKVTVADVNLKGLYDLKWEITEETEELDENVNIEHLDLADRESVKLCCDGAKHIFGPVDIVINNAGIM